MEQRHAKLLSEEKKPPNADLDGSTAHVQFKKPDIPTEKSIPV